jgi:hypothetical protein
MDPNLVIMSGAYWQKLLKEKIERVKSERTFSSQGALLEDTGLH